MRLPVTATAPLVMISRVGFIVMTVALVKSMYVNLLLVMIEIISGYGGNIPRKRHDTNNRVEFTLQRRRRDYSATQPGLDGQRYHRAEQCMAACPSWISLA